MRGHLTICESVVCNRIGSPSKHDGAPVGGGGDMQRSGSRQCTRGESRSVCRRPAAARIALDGLMGGSASMDSKGSYHNQLVSELVTAHLHECLLDGLMGDHASMDGKGFCLGQQILEPFRAPSV